MSVRWPIAYRDPLRGTIERPLGGRRDHWGPMQSAPRFTQRGRAQRALSIALVAVAAVLLLAAVLLPNAGGGSLPVLYLLVAFRPLFLICITAFAFVVGVLGVVLRWRWPALVAIAVVVAVGTSVAVPAAERSPSVEPSHVAASDTGALRVLEWNTDQQDVDATTIRALIEQTNPNIVVLPEYFTQVAKGTLAAVAKQRDMQILGSIDSAATVMVSRSLGDYKVDDRDTPPWAGFVAVPADLSSPRLVIAHLQRPDITSTALWRRHIRWARKQCKGNALAIGDFNATTDNISPSHTLGQCVDSATALGQRPQGTWPTALPAWLGATIDHVFAGPSWRPAAFSVLHGLDQAGADHRPTFAVLVPARVR